MEVTGKQDWRHGVISTYLPIYLVLSYAAFEKQ